MKHTGATVCYDVPRYVRCLQKIDASNCCEFSSYVDKDGGTRVKVEYIVNEDEKQRVWDLLSFKHKRDRHMSVEPSEMLFD